MLDITVTETLEESAELKAFGDVEWESADREHYGDAPVDFTKRKFSLVAREDGTIVGYVRLVFDMGVLHLESILVAGALRGSGIGQRLMQAVEAHGTRIGAHKIWLETGKDWAARGLYEKLGYRVFAELPDYYAHRDFVLMDKSL